MTVVDAVQRDLERLGGKAQSSSLAATALALAAELDDVVAEQECEECGHVQSWTPSHNSATSKSMVARELRETMGQLRALCPPKQEKDRLDEVTRKREQRRRSAGA